MWMISMLLGMGIIVVLICGAFGLAYYVVTSLFAMKVCEKSGVAYAGLCWIPYVRYYKMAEAGDDGSHNADIFGWIIPREVLGLWWIASLVLGRVPHIGGMLTLAIQIIFLGITFRDIFAKMEHRSRQDMLPWGLVSGFLPIVGYIKFMIYSGQE